MKSNYYFIRQVTGMLIFLALYFFIATPAFAQKDTGKWEKEGGEVFSIDLSENSPTLHRIVGGNNASISDYPWQVAVTTSNNFQFCGGTIINEYWIVTAAHCLGSYSNIRVRAGVTNKTHTGQTITVAQEIPHPQYHANSSRNDIALLRLSSPLDLSGSNAKAIPIVTQALAASGMQDPGVMAVITGWGATSEGGSATNTLQVAQVPIVSNADAMNIGGYSQGQITDDMICAGFLGQGGVDACQGDSGGPFVVPDASSPVGYRLAGATSWGIGCARPNYPGVYARVSHFQNWIEQTTGLSWDDEPGPGIECDPQSLPYTQTFDNTSVPSCWQVADNQGNGQVWRFGTFNGGISGASGNYAYLNSDGFGSGNTQNADLISPVFNLAEYTTVNLSFKHYFRQYQDVSAATLYYSINNGNTWNQIQQWTASTSNPAVFDMEIPDVAGQTQVQFKWNYTGTWGYAWSVDDIEITGTKTTQYQLTIASQGQGSVSPQPGTYTHAENTVINLSATPSNGYEFDKWVVNGSTYQSATMQLTLTQNVTATAYFVEESVQPGDCVVHNLPYFQPFSGTTTPDCWNVVDHLGNGQVWQFGTFNGGLSGASGNYAYLNSDNYGNGNSQNTDLVSPSFDFSDYSSVTLSFKHYFRQYQTSSTATLSYSTNNGSTWQQIQQWTTSTANPATFSLELPQLAGQSQVKFKWNYTGSWGYYWSIDDVQLTGVAGCQTISQFPFTENFSGSFVPACWDSFTTASNTWASTTGYTIGSTQVAPVSGNRFAYVNWQAVNQDERLITPAFNFTQLSNPVLNFWFNGSSYWSVDQGNCELQVIASVNGGNWTVIWRSSNHGAFSSGSNYNWLEADVDLSGYSSAANVRLAFRYTGNDGANFGIDQISVGNGNKSRMNEETEYDLAEYSMKVFPNPANNQVSVTIQGVPKSGMIRILNLNGQLLKQRVLSGNDEQRVESFNIEGFSPGVYFMQIVSQEYSRMVKFVVEQ